MVSYRKAYNVDPRFGIHAPARYGVAMTTRIKQPFKIFSGTINEINNE